MLVASTTTPYELRGERETTRGVRGRLWGCNGAYLAGEHDGLEEDRSGPGGAWSPRAGTFVDVVNQTAP